MKKDGRNLCQQEAASAMDPAGIISVGLFYAGGLPPARVDLLAPGPKARSPRCEGRKEPSWPQNSASKSHLSTKARPQNPAARSDAASSGRCAATSATSSTRAWSTVPASSARWTFLSDYDAFVDFYLDDYQFERFWNDPFRYLGRLKLFAGVIEPDFSTCLDFPVALKAYSVYRNQALGSFLQRNGILCVPNVRCEPGLPWMLDGTPRGSSIAIGARAAVKKPSDREALMRAVRFAVEVLEPTEIIWYGSTSYGIGDWLLSLGVPVHVCPARIRG